MNLKQAVNNINQVLQFGRITMPGGPLTAQEHVQLNSDFSLLVTRARLADSLEHKEKERKETAKAFNNAAEGAK
jgi:hypothetical protein